MSQQFSLAEVAVNDGKNNKPVWIIIRDIVYDVSNYLDDVSKQIYTLVNIIGISNNICSIDYGNIICLYAMFINNNLNYISASRWRRFDHRMGRKGCHQGV